MSASANAMTFSSWRAGALVPIKNWGSTCRKRRPSGLSLIQLSLPVPDCETMSGTSASPHSPMAPMAMSTPRVRRCS